MQWRMPELPSSGPRLSGASRVLMLRAAVAAVPARQDLRRQLAEALFARADFDQVIDFLGPDLPEADDDPRLLYLLGRALTATGDYDRAARVLQAAAARGSESSCGALALVQWWLARHDAALETALGALQAQPSSHFALLVAASILLARGERSRLWDLSVDLIARIGWTGYAPSAMVAAATTEEQRERAAAVGGSLHAVAICRPEFGATFTADLAYHLQTHAESKAMPVIAATIGAGERIDQLEIDAHASVQQLLAAIRIEVERYVAEARSAAGIIVERVPRELSLTAWALVAGRDAREEWHLHPNGWVSGVYYVSVPERPSGVTPIPGAIEFGAYPFDEEREPLWPRRTIAPAAGDLLLFPSFAAHRTWPTNADAPRVCVAFDVTGRFI